MSSPSPTRTPRHAVSFPGWWLAALVLAATGARAWLHFRTPLSPGINGAYYYIQARAVLEHGLPGVPDLPLTFWVHAALARLVQACSGLTRESAIVLAVKCADSLLPALAAVPVAWLGWRWQRNSPRPSALAALAPAAVVCLGAQALSMTGEFEKNSLALVWLAALAPAAHMFLSRPGLKTALAPLGLLALLGLTHVGVLGAALVFSALLAVGATLTAAPEMRRRILGLTLVGTAILAVAGAVIYKTYDPARAVKLVKAFTDPATFIESGGPPRPAGASAGPMRNAGAPDRSGGPGRLAGGPPGGGGGPPGSSGLMRWAPGVIFLGVGLAGLGLAWSRRKTLPAADRTVLAAAAVTAAALGGPFFGADKAQRLMLIAAVPAAMTLSFLLAAITRDAARRIAGGLVIAGTLASAALFLPHGGQPTISEATYAELQTLARFTAPAERSLIVARHGLEWWSAWVLHTHIAQPQAVKPADWTKFDRVFYLTEKKRSGPMGGGMPFGPGQPPGRRPQAPGQDGDQHNDDMGPPNGPPNGGPAGGFPGGGPPGQFMGQEPANTTTLHDGAELKFVLAPTAPEQDAALVGSPQR